MYQNLFLGYFFSCNNFGHKSIEYRYYAISDHVRDRNRGSYNNSKDDYVRKTTRNFHGFHNINYNSFDHLLDYNIECYKCNNYGNIVCYCTSNIVGPPKKRRKNVFFQNINKNNQCFGKGSKSKKRGLMKWFVMIKDVMS